MPYVSVPKDISKVKPKLAFGLTKRQIVCFGAGIALGVPLLFLMRGFVGNNIAALLMLLVMLPFFLLGMFEKNGQPLEVILKQYVQFRYQRPKHRPYQTNNYYAVLERQAALEKEVKSIVRKAEKRAARRDAEALRRKKDSRK